MNVPFLAQAFAAVAAVGGVLGLVSSGLDPRLSLVPPVAVAVVLVAGVVLVVAGIRTRRLALTTGGLVTLGVGGAVAGSGTVGAAAFVTGLALVASAEAATASDRVRDASSAYLRTAAPVGAVSVVIALLAAAGPRVAEGFLPPTLARSLDLASVYAPVLVALTATALVAAAAWARERSRERLDGGEGS